MLLMSKGSKVVYVAFIQHCIQGNVTHLIHVKRVKSVLCIKWPMASPKYAAHCMLGNSSTEVCIPTCTGQRVCIPACIGQGCLPRGVSAQGVSVQGVSAQWCLPREVSAQGFVVDTPSCEQNDRQV